MRPELRRYLTIAAITLILGACSASAYLAWQGGRRPKAASTLAAGVAFSLLIGSRGLRRN